MFLFCCCAYWLYTIDMTNIPQVYIIVATSLDGFIAQEKSQPSIEWASKEDNQLFHQRTKKTGVIVMGGSTYQTINSKYLPLAGRLNIVYSHQSREELVKKLGIDVSKVNDQTLQVTSLSPIQLIAQLQNRGFSEIAICGGSSIYTQFLQSGLVKKLYVTVEPVIFGEGIKLFNQVAVKSLNLISSKKLNKNGSMLFEYEVIGENETPRKVVNEG